MVVGWVWPATGKCDAALAVLDHLTTPGFLDDLNARGLYLQRGLRRLAKRHKGAVVDVRGLGLMLGIELKEKAGPYVKQLMEKGIIVLLAGATVIRLLPPLVIKKKELTMALRRVAKVFKRIDG